MIAPVGREKRPFLACFGSFFTQTRNDVNLIGDKRFAMSKVAGKNEQCRHLRRKK